MKRATIVGVGILFCVGISCGGGPGEADLPPEGPGIYAWNPNPGRFAAGASNGDPTDLYANEGRFANQGSPGLFSVEGATPPIVQQPGDPPDAGQDNPRDGGRR